MPALRPAVDSRFGRGCGLVFCIGWLGFCIFWCSAALASRQPQMMVCAIPHIAIGVGLLFWVVKPAVMALKIGAPEVEISSDLVHAGDRFQFRFSLPARQAMDVDKISVRFLFRESASYSQGTTTRTDTNDQVLWEWEQPRTHYEANQSLQLEQALQVPAGAMHTFSATHNKLQYLVVVHVAIVGWPDFKEEYEVQVAPGRTLAMAHIDIRIELEGGTPDHGWLRYAPGKTVRGTVRVTPDEPIECRHVWVRLEWMTEGRGTRDNGKAAEVDVYQGPIPAGGIIQKFALTLPEQPHSYRGRLVSIVWGVVAEVDVSWVKKPRAIQSFVMAPVLQRQGEPAIAEHAVAAPAESAPATAPPAGWDLILVSPGLQFRELGQALMEVMPEADMSVVQRANSIEPLKLLRSVPEEQARQAAARLQGAGATTEVRPSTDPQQR